MHNKYDHSTDTSSRFCVDINSPRTLQTATEKLFLAVSQYAKEVPIVVVATKKDEFLDASCFLEIRCLRAN